MHTLRVLTLWCKSKRYLAGKDQTVSEKICSDGLSWTKHFTWHHLEMKQSFPQWQGIICPHNGTVLFFSPFKTMSRYFMFWSASYVNFVPFSCNVSSISSWSRVCISRWTASWWEAKHRRVEAVSNPARKKSSAWAMMSSSSSSEGREKIVTFDESNGNCLAIFTV